MNINEKQKLLGSLFEQVKVNIVVADRDRVIKLVNPAALNLFGYQSNELTGQSIDTLFAESFSTRVAEHYNQHLKQNIETPMTIEEILPARRKDESDFLAEVNTTTFYTKQNLHYLIFINDITGIKKVKTQKKERNKSLEHQNRNLNISNVKLEALVEQRTRFLNDTINELERSKSELKGYLNKVKELGKIKSRFLVMASHEFRTPLTAILSSAALIDEYKSDQHHGKISKHVSKIKNAVTNLNDKLSDFLTITNIEGGQVLVTISAFNIQELIQSICNEMKGLTKKGQTIKVHCSCRTNFNSDPKLIRVIITNLLSNAIKFSDENKPIELTCAVKNSYLILTISDHGIGISDEDKAHLFESFYRGHNALNVQGTGLGLNIANNYVKKLDGKIELTSVLNKGTTFTIRIPGKNPA